MNRSKELNFIVKGGLLVALAFVLSFFEFPIIPQAPWLKIDFSALPLLFGALTFGPFYGILLTILQQGLVFVLKGSQTGGVGEIANIIMVGAFVFTVAYIYRTMHRENRSLVIGSLLGTLTLIVVGILTNKFILIPLFFPGGFPGGNAALNTYLFKFIPIFNLVKGLLISVIGLLLFSKLGLFFKRELRTASN